MRIAHFDLKELAQETPMSLREFVSKINHGLDVIYRKDKSYSDVVVVFNTDTNTLDFVGTFQEVKSVEPADSI